MVMFGVFKNKKRLAEISDETKKGFESVKKDILSVTGWIKHLDSENNLSKKDILEFKKDLSTVKEDIEGLKNIFSMNQNLNTNTLFKQPFKTNKRLFNKQTNVQTDQTNVQTGVQTPNLSDFSITERAILLVLLNTDMKLSYDDLATMLGKEKSTIRGQINTIKSKSESLILEIVEKNGKKRIYLDEKMKDMLLKKQKVSLRNK